jgi:TPR repeat protein
MLKKIPPALLTRGIDLLNKNQFESAMRVFELYPDDPACQARMAEIIYQDDGRVDRESVAFSLYKQAAEQEYVDAFFFLAYFYECGIGVEVSLEHAKHWYLKCIDLDVPNGLLRLGNIYLLSKDGKSDWVQAYRYFYLSYVTTGSSRALEMMNDALYCMTRSEHEQALSLADDWIESRYKLHIKCLDQDVDKVLRTEEEFKFVTGNCEASLTFSQTKQVLGMLKSKQFDAATGILQAYIEDALGQFLLGMVNYVDKSRPSGRRDAIPFFKAAASKGCPLAFFRLGYCFAEGDGVAANVADSIVWYLKAAELGDSVAQYNLAQLHYRCVELPRDYISAYKWFFLSHAHGCSAAEHQLFGLTNKMSDVDQDESWAAVRMCVEKISEIKIEHRHPDHGRYFGKSIGREG